MADLKIQINGISIWEKAADIFTEMLHDARIKESVRDEYRARIIDSFSDEPKDIKPPENRAMQPVSERKHDSLCDECGFHRPLMQRGEFKVCAICEPLYK